MKRTIFGFFPTSVSSFVCLHTSQVTSTKVRYFSIQIFFSPLLWFGINYANVCFFLRFIQLGTVSFSFAPFEYPLKYLQFRVSSIQTIVVHLSVPNDLTISPFVGVVFSLLLLVSFLGFCVQCIFISIRSFDIRHKTQNLHTIYLYIYVYFRDSSMCTHK